MSMNRREWIEKSAKAGLAIGLGNCWSAGNAQAAPVSRVATGTPSQNFPAKLLWGAATAAHRVGWIAVDRETQKRTVKPSAIVLGKIAKNNSL